MFLLIVITDPVPTMHQTSCFLSLSLSLSKSYFPCRASELIFFLSASINLYLFSLSLTNIHTHTHERKVWSIIAQYKKTASRLTLTISNSSTRTSSWVKSHQSSRNSFRWTPLLIPSVIQPLCNLYEVSATTQSALSNNPETLTYLKSWNSLFLFSHSDDARIELST